MLCFFSRKDGDDEVVSRGVDCADLQTARRLAMLHVAQAEDSISARAWNGDEVRIKVRNERDELLTTIIILAVDAQPAKDVEDERSAANPTGEGDFILGPGHAWRKRRDRNT